MKNSRQQKTLDSNIFKVPTQSLQRGIYYLQVHCARGNAYQRIVIEK